MADSRTDPRVFLLDPDERGVLPLDAFHVPRRLARTVRQDLFEIRVDSAFRDVVEACAERVDGREETWINRRIKELYLELHERGAAHSIEVWADGGLVGGLYGVALGGAFFGESMFSRARDASKTALVHLVARLIVGRFQLLDAQFTTAHLKQFGAEQIDRVAYHERLKAALGATGEFTAGGDAMSGADALALIREASERREAAS
jgi:leucyl/phenylalanyl-tRNA--protein transferase